MQQLGIWNAHIFLSKRLFDHIKNFGLQKTFSPFSEDKVRYLIRGHFNVEVTHLFERGILFLGGQAQISLLTSTKLGGLFLEFLLPLFNRANLFPTKSLQRLDELLVSPIKLWTKRKEVVKNVYWSCYIVVGQEKKMQKKLQDVYTKLVKKLSLIKTTFASSCRAKVWYRNIAHQQLHHFYIELFLYQGTYELKTNLGH